jgi:precorrin-6Y C5,15-methyltransferase (decarboxylating)
MLDADAFAAPHVVLCLAPHSVSAMRRDNQPAAAPMAGWALPETAYTHRDSMITKAEVRAYAVARLRPRLGRLVLDIGAGSGSVGIECAALGAAVVSVERDADACRLIAENAARHGVQIRVVEGSAPEVLDDLPDPDAAFVGGGGVAAVHGVVRRRVRTVVAAFAALDTAIAAHGLLAESGYHVEGTQLSAARLSELPRGSLRLAAVNPVVVLTAELP